MSLIQPVYAVIKNPLVKDADTAILDPNGFLNRVIGALFSIFFFVAVLYFLWYFMMGAYAMIHTEGDPKKYEQARDQLTYAFVGLIISLSVFGVLYFVGTVLGIPGLQGPNFSITLPTL